MMPHEIADLLATELRLSKPDPETIRDLSEELDDLVGREAALDMLRIQLAAQGVPHSS